jgi:hypothetical protein
MYVCVLFLYLLIHMYVRVLFLYLFHLLHLSRFLAGKFKRRGGSPYYLDQSARLKGTVQRDLRGVKSGINVSLWILILYCRRLEIHVKLLSVS